MSETKIESTVCNLCGSDSFDIVGSFLFLGFRLNLVECNKCALGYVNPRISKENMEDFFQSYRDVSTKEINAWYRIGLSNLKTDLEMVGSILPKGKLLDVGCSYGFFLKEMENRGWVTYGVEISKLTSQYAKNELKLSVFNGSLKEANFPDNFFDLIVSLDTLYFSPDPLGELREMYRILNEGKYVYIRVVNTFFYLKLWQIGRRILGARKELTSNPFFTENHLFYFSPMTISLMLTNAGFKDIRFFNAKVSDGKRKFIEKSLLYFAAIFFKFIYLSSNKRLAPAFSVNVLARK